MSVGQGHSYFDIEGDNDRQGDDTSGAGGSHDDGLATLTWRGDPSETHSDYTIVVVTDELHTLTYHVHKSVMCFGPRQSKFFARIMLNNNKNKNNNKGGTSKNGSDNNPAASATNAPPSTKVELTQRDADNIPILLDFIYAPSVQAMEAYHEGSSAAGGSTVLTAASTFTSSYSLLTVQTRSHDEDSNGTISGAPSTDSATTNNSKEDILITTKNAVSLRFLARKFEVEPFMLAVNRFIQKDLSFKTGPTYLNRGWEYQDDRLVKSAQRLCVENFQLLNIKALTKLPLQLLRILLKALESFDEENKALSTFLSDVVCEYMEKNPKALSAAILLELTDPIRMPYIAAEAAIGFTALVKELNSDDATQYWDGLVQLCRRCAKAVVRQYGWNDFCVDAAVTEYLGHSTSNRRVSRVDSLLFATSFASALEQAQDDYEEIIVEQERLESTVEALSSTIALMEDIGVRKEEHMGKQQKAIQDARKQILDLKQQITDIKEHQRRLYVAQHVVAPPPPPDTPPQPAATSRPQPQQQYHHQQQHQPHKKGPDLTPEDIVRDLIAPSEVVGTIIASRKDKNKPPSGRKPELRSKEEMRKHSLM